MIIASGIHWMRDYDGGILKMFNIFYETNIQKIHFTTVSMERKMCVSKETMMDFYCGHGNRQFRGSKFKKWREYWQFFLGPGSYKKSIGDSLEEFIGSARF